MNGDKVARARALAHETLLTHAHGNGTRGEPDEHVQLARLVLELLPAEDPSETTREKALGRLLDWDKATLDALADTGSWGE